MQIIKCENCKKEFEVEDDIIMVVCGCGATTDVNIFVIERGYN